MVLKMAKIIGCLTLVGVLYTNMQMRIIDLAYQANIRQRQIREVVQRNGYITYSILTMKSASHLGKMLLNEDGGMKFVNPDNVVDLSLHRDVVANKTQSIKIKENKTLLGLLSFTSRAEARMK